MLLGRDGDLLPKLLVDERQHGAARANDNCAFFVFYENVGERRIHGRCKPLPGETAVRRTHDRTIGTHRDSVQFVFCKMYRIKLVALRYRILPDPPRASWLRRYYRKENNHRDTEAQRQ